MKERMLVRKRMISKTDGNLIWIVSDVYRVSIESEDVDNNEGSGGRYCLCM